MCSLVVAVLSMVQGLLKRVLMGMVAGRNKYIKSVFERKVFPLTPVGGLPRLDLRDCAVARRVLSPSRASAVLPKCLQAGGQEVFLLLAMIWWGQRCWPLSSATRPGLCAILT